jgi:branched-chain amino acid transport system permease protein
LDPTIMLFLLQDGVTNGAIYVLLALATVLIFSVTRVTFIPLGDFVAFGALTLASLSAGRVPGTVGLVGGLSLLAGVQDVLGYRRDRTAARAARGVLLALVPAAGAACVWLLAPLAARSAAIAMAFTVLLLVPMGPLLYRVVYQPIAGASVLLLLIVSAALHYLLAGLGLFFFGPEGVRTTPLLDGDISIGALDLTGQSLVVLAATILLLIALPLFFTRTLPGKALRAAAGNRIGARLMGISVPRAGMLAFGLAAFIGVVSGILIGPTVTVFYDTGFAIGLRGFVGAIIGGLASYPLAAIGALLVGLTESFAAFYASDFKDIIVFSLIVPVLLVFSLRHRAVED